MTSRSSNWVVMARVLTLALAAISRAEAQTAPQQPAEQSANAQTDDPRQIEAAMIYRNLRLEQEIGHDQALAVLRRVGYPVDRIVEIK